jgi:hypothetical protein
MIMEQWPSCNVGNKHDEGCMDSRLLDTVVDEDIENAHKLGDHHSSVAPLMAPSIKMGHFHVDHHENCDIVTMKERRNTPPYDGATLSVADQSATSIQSADDNDNSNLTSVTLQLREAAVKTIQHVKSFRTTQAAISLDVKVAMLAKEFPPAWIFTTADEGDGDYLEAEESSECVNCIKTLSASEVLQFRQAMHNYEKQRMISMVQALSDQMNAFHELLDENQHLKEEISKINKEMDRNTSERDRKISGLEKAMISMKLDLAQFRSSEDHHRLSIARLEFALKKAYAENNALHQKRGMPGDMPNEPEAGRTSYDPRRRLSKSLTSAAYPDIDENVCLWEQLPKKNPPLTRSWSIKDSFSFLDKSVRKEDQNNAGNSLLEKSRSPSKSSTLRREPPGVRANRSRSMVEPPTRARALIEAEFMPWGCEKSEDDGSGRSKILKKSSSFVEPTKSRLFHEPIGSDVFLPNHGNWNDDDATLDARSAFSNLTATTHEDDRGRLSKSSKESLLAHGTSNDRLSLLASMGSYFALEFEPAKPQLQRAMSLRGVDFRQTCKSDASGGGGLDT